MYIDSLPVTQTNTILRAFMHNEDKYPDSYNYHPERYLEDKWPTYKEPLTQFPTVKGLTSFGFGQRQCLGQSLTHDELIVACGALCWGFNMHKKIDTKTGKEIDIDTHASNSLLIVKPDPFQMAFTPRSREKREEIIQQWTVAEKRDNEKREEFLRNAKANYVTAAA
jgi:hypothetical protein